MKIPGSKKWVKFYMCEKVPFRRSGHNYNFSTKE